MEIRPLMSDSGYNWDSIDLLFRKSNILKQYPILIVEPSIQNRDFRKHISELFFESFDLPSLFFSKSAALTCYALGRVSGVVLDSGASSTVVAPVQEGYVLQKAITHSPMGGEYLTNMLASALKNTVIKPPYSFRRTESGIEYADFPNTTVSFHDFSVQNVLRNLKEKYFKMPESGFSEPPAASNYTLPDGTSIDISEERFSIPETMFSETGGLQKLVLYSIGKCDNELKTELTSNVLLTGGNTLLAGFVDRMSNSLSSNRARVLTGPSQIDRANTPYIGGSLLAMLDAFQQHWLTKAEYQEFGIDLADRKCP